MSNTKQLIVMRKDLNMRKGKMVAQGSHSAVAWLTRRIAEMDKKVILNGQNHKQYIAYLKPAEIEWMKDSFVKICVGVESEEELMEIHDAAKAAGLMVHLITDAGLTEFAGVPTKTCLAIGPDYSKDIDKITGHLKLL